MSSVANLAILGSTGSIGQQTLDIVRALPRKFRVVALAAGKNTSLLSEQVSEFKPVFVYYQEGTLGGRLSDTDYEFLPLEEIASHPNVDTVVIATSGASGLNPLLAAVKAGKKVCLANKESLVAAGKIITEAAKLSGAQILPIDSEHSAIWQCLSGEKQKPACLVLTASGGPFVHYSADQLKAVSVEQALNHPSWRMGRKVTIDSATLMNKGLEVIEAHWLFSMPFDNIRVIIHPQSIIHSMVEFIDGSIKAQLSCPDMRFPIQYALSYPGRMANSQLPRLDLDKIGSLTFEQPDFDVFPCLKLAIEAGRRGGTFPAVLCAADEVAVELFLSKRIRFIDIAGYMEQVLSEHQSLAETVLEEIRAADTWARQVILRLAGGVD